MKKVLYLLLLLLSLQIFSGYSQFSNLTQEITRFTLNNPAAYGQVKGLQFGILNENRFVSVKGSPRTSVFVFDTTFRYKTNASPKDTKMGIGLKFTNESVSITVPISLIFPMLTASL